MPCLLALDQGTTSSRAIVFEADGHIRALAQREFTQHFPRPGWVEHDADEIWSTQVGVAAEALAAAGLAPGELAALGLTNQRETIVVWDRASGRPIHNAIVWQDRRTAAQCAALKEAGHEPLVQSRTGLLLDPYFSATKLAWLLDNVPGARANAEAGRLAAGTMDSWLAYKLTAGKVHATDPSNASRTLLFDIHKGCWDDELLELFNVPRALLPEVRGSAEAWGEVANGLPGEGTPIAGVAGDQQAALAGQGATSPGLAKCTFGTGCFLLAHTGDRPQASANKLLTTVAWQLGRSSDSNEARGQTRGLEYALEGSVFVGGAAVQWLRDGLGLIERSADIETLAAQVDDSEGVVFVPTFAGLGAPHWDPAARGTLLGLTRGTTAAHIARATLEGIAHQVTDLIEAMSADAGAPLAELRVDGGAAANDLLMQQVADFSGVPLVRPVVTESTALGAAWLAGRGVGLWTDGGLSAARAVERRFEPAPTNEKVAAARVSWGRAVERAKGWAEGG